MGSLMIEEDTKDRLIALTDWPNYHPWPSEAGLRNLVNKAKTENNGFDAVILRIGRRILISEKEFFKWVSLKNEGL